MAQRISSSIFIGRRPELERLAAALDAAASGRPSLVLVAGEAGVGKTRLVTELAARAEAGGARTLAGGCLDVGEGGLPFAPFSEALKGLAGSLGRESDAALAEVFGSSSAVLEGLVPELRRVAPADVVPVPLPDPAARRARLFDAVLEVLGRLSTPRPVLLVLEDLHWADGSTRDLLRFLLRNVDRERLLMVATLRSDELHRRHPVLPLISELSRSDRVERIDLGPLGRDEIAAQLTAILGHRPEASLADDVAERSDGLPFYVEELAAAGAAEGAVPASLRDILGLRLASLPDASLAPVRAASALRRWFPLEALAAATGRDEVALVPGLRGAIEAGVLVSAEGPAGPSYGFRHALLREAAYDELLPAERIAIHARMADFLTARLADTSGDEPALLADLALHTYRAGDQPRALAAAVRAVHALAGVTAFREALGHAERALELWSRVDDAETCAGISHGELLSLAGLMATNAGRRDLALAHAQAALRELGPSASPERQAEVLIDLSIAAGESGALELQVEPANRLRGLLDELTPSPVQARALRQVAASHNLPGGRLRDAVGLFERAMTVAKALHDDHLWAAATSMYAHHLGTYGRAGRAERLADASLPVASATWPTRPHEDGQLGAGAALWFAGRFEDAARVWAAAKRAAIRYGTGGRDAHAFDSSEAEALFELGHLEDAERLATTAAGHPLLWGRDVLAKVHAVRGHVEAARELLPVSELREDTLRQHFFDAGLWTLEAHAVLERAAGDFDRLRAVVDEARAEAARSADGDLAYDFALGRLLGSAIGGAADHAVLARRRRRPAEAVEAEELACEWLAVLRAIVERGRADGGAGAWMEATLTTADAESQRARGRPDPAAWRDAASAWRSLSNPYGLATAQLRLAEALLELGGDRGDATEALRDAHTAATTMGVVPLVEAIETLAGHARIELTAEPTEPVESETAASPLTARERDVLRLVAAGQTNREIGNQLFISEKTVSVHVSNGMRKLDALSRYEAAAAAQQRGYLD